MTIGAHFLISWISSVQVLKNRRERTLVTLAGVLPDLDGLGIIVDFITGTTNYYLKYHHYLGHSIFSAIFLASVATFFAKSQKLIVWILSFGVVHLHYLCDIVGSKGPDGFQYPIYYLAPLDSNFSLTWSYQWELNAWQNQVILLFLIAISVYYLKTKKITVLEVISIKLNDKVLAMYSKYFPMNKHFRNY